MMSLTLVSIKEYQGKLVARRAERRVEGEGTTITVFKPFGKYCLLFQEFSYFFKNFHNFSQKI